MTPDLIDAYKELLSAVRSFPEGTNLHFLRHGQTDNNLNRIAQGARMTEQPLNRTGIGQAHDSGHKLDMTTFDACFTSPAVRAKQTFEIVRRYFTGFDNTSFELAELQEIDWGAGIDGKVMSETRYQELNDEFFTNKNPEAKFDDNENILDVMRRATKAMLTSSELLHEKIDSKEIVLTERPLNLLYTGHGFFFGILLTAIIDSRIGLVQKPDTAGLKMLTVSHNSQHNLTTL